MKQTFRHRNISAGTPAQTMMSTHYEVGVVVLLALLMLRVVVLPEPVGATSVVALMDRANQRVVIATDCRVNRTSSSLSECKIVDEPGCTVAIAGLYREKETSFDLRKIVQNACGYPGDLRAKAEEFLRLSKVPYERAVRHIRSVDKNKFNGEVHDELTEVVFAGLQDGHVALIVRGMLTDSSGRIRFQRLESVSPSYTRAGYFLGLNGHIRSHIKTHPHWANEDYTELAHRFVDLEIKAHPELASPPISELQIEKDGNVHWLDKGACDKGESSGSINETVGN